MCKNGNSEEADDFIPEGEEKQTELWQGSAEDD